MLYQNIRVGIPQGKKYKPRVLHGISYLYYRENSYRVNGKLKHNECSLGKIVTDSEHNIDCLIPNEKYYEHFKLDKPTGEVLVNRGRPRKVQKSERYEDLPEDSIMCAGYSVAVMYLTKESGLYDILIESFGEEIANNILAIAMFFAAGCPYGMSAIEKFTKNNICFTGEIIKKNRMTDHYQSITRHDIAQFYKLWIPKASENDYICYDVTSISSYSKKLQSVEYGYNRDHEKLKQVNVGMFCTLTTSIPLYMSEYNGSINDFTNFPDVIQKARVYGIDINKTTFVMDGGFALEQTLSSDIIGNNPFIVGAPFDFGLKSRTYLENWDRNSQDTIVFTFDDDIIEAKEESISCGRIKCRLFMYYSESRRENELATIKHNINEMSAKIERRKKSFTEKFLAEFRPLFKIDITQDGEIKYEIDREEYRNITANYGYFAIYCSDESIDIKEALRLYRRKDIIEKSFDVLKNDIINERLHVSSDKSLTGKSFIVMIGLIVRKLIENKLKEIMKQHNVTYGEIIAALTGIKCRKHNKEWILDGVLTKEERIYMEALGIPLSALGK